VENILDHPSFLPVVLYELKFMGVFQERDLGIKRVGKNACRHQVTSHTFAEKLLINPIYAKCKAHYNCGIRYAPLNTTQEDFSRIFQKWESQRMNSFRDYAQNCYSNTPDPYQKACSTFVRPRLAHQVETNANCPFQEQMCLSKDKNIRIDTGLLDSNDDLGFNAPQNKRIQFRRVDHYTPLVLDGHVKK